MTRPFGFGSKLLLATSLLLVASFTVFILYNDAHRQVANTVQLWLGGRLALAAAGSSFRG